MTRCCLATPIPLWIRGWWIPMILAYRTTKGSCPASGWASNSQNIGMPGIGGWRTGGTTCRIGSGSCVPATTWRCPTAGGRRGRRRRSLPTRLRRPSWLERWSTSCSGWRPSAIPGSSTPRSTGPIRRSRRRRRTTTSWTRRRCPLRSWIMGRRSALIRS